MTIRTGPPRTRPHLLQGLLLAVVTTSLLVGCSQGQTSTTSERAAGSAADQGSSESMPAPADADAGRASISATVSAATQVITTATVGVVVADPVKAAVAVSDLVDQSGGRVESRNERARSTEDDQQAWAELTVRIPAEKLTATLSSLASIGTVENTTISSTDVSAEVTDVTARIEALEVSVARLETLMAQATTTAELLEAESTLTQRQSDLESLQAVQAQLADQVSMSTLTISLTTTPASPVLAPSGFWGGLSAGWDALTTTLNGVVVAIGAALPWLAVAGTGYLLYRWVRRQTRRRVRVAS